MRRRIHFFSTENSRFLVLKGFFLLFFIFVLLKLFSLQIIRGKELQKKGKEIRSSSIEISARRGGIFTLDSKTEDITPLAINTTLYKVFVDAREKDGNGRILTPSENLPLIASFLTEELYTQKQFQKCINTPSLCPKGSILEIKDNKGRIIHRTFPTYSQAKKMFEAEVLKKISEQKTSLIYATNVPEKKLKEIDKLNIPNIIVSFEEKNISINLEGLTTEKKQKISDTLASFFNADPEKIKQQLRIDRKGYIPILSRIPSEDKDKIILKKINAQKEYYIKYSQYKKQKKAGISPLIPPKKPFLSSIGFTPEPLRYYPENSLLSNVIGFVANEEGKYGIEKYYNNFLSGENGILETSRDVNGNSVNIKKNNLEQVIDGGDVVLTIDRILQQKVEKILDEKVSEYDADSAQAILMNPQTGKILVMANTPRFDPNFFGNVYVRRRTTPEDFEKIHKTTPLERKDREGNFVTAKFNDFEESWELGFDPEFFVFENIWGAGAYDNKVVSSLYEPGSVIKPLVMASALEEGEITTSSRYFESGPLEVGKFTIKNADGKYLGSQSMSNIIERSANLGMAYIAERMGKPLLYDSLKNLGFGEYTDISLPDELSGNVNYYKTWSDARMYNASFGQGFSATPLQVIKAWTTLASGGYLVSPRIVSYLKFSDGRIEKKEVKKIRVFSDETVKEMNAILINSTEKGVAKKGRVKGHYIAGKTGTSQISNMKGTGYEDLSEKGSTITSFIGFAPVDDPEFLLLVKFDRPRKGENGHSVYGSTTAAPTFSEIMKIVFLYYDTPKDKF